jgi:hypothetical protein
MAFGDSTKTKRYLLHDHLGNNLCVQQLENCRAGGVAQVVECLLSKHKAQTSNPSAAKK